jgi:hypothetical protein
MDNFYQWTSKWNKLTGLPVPGHSRNYYFPANVNAAMAAINKAMFPNATQQIKIAIDSLEANFKARVPCYSTSSYNQ